MRSYEEADFVEGDARRAAQMIQQATGRGNHNVRLLRQL